MKKQSFLRSLVVVLFLMPGQSHAQYKISSTTPPLLTGTTEENKPDEALITAIQFFELAKEGKRSEWENLLSKECFNNKVPKDYVNRWFNQLTNSEHQYRILRENPSPRTNQKILYYACSLDKKKERPMVLVKEHGMWKIFHLKL